MLEMRKNGLLFPLKTLDLSLSMFHRKHPNEFF